MWSFGFRGKVEKYILVTKLGVASETEAFKNTILWD